MIHLQWLGTKNQGHKQSGEMDYGKIETKGLIYPIQVSSGYGSFKSSSVTIQV